MAARPLDHLVLCVRDLAAARDAYERFGFTTTPPARHPWGTVNSLVQLQGNFLELLSVADDAEIAPAPPGHFSFGAYTAAFLRRGEGMSMLALSSSEAHRDQAGFAAAGLETYAPFDFSRRAPLPDGSQATVGFSLAFVTDARMPEAAFFVCQQHAPQHFWKPDYQRHANGAKLVSDVVLCAGAPAELGDLVGKLLGDDNLTRDGRSLVARTTRGCLTLMTPEDWSARFPGMNLPAPPRSPRFAAYATTVASLDATEGVLRSNAVPHHRSATALQIAPEAAFGIAIEFVEG